MKWFRKLRERRGREAEGAFLVEGPRALSEALKADVHPISVLYSPDLADTYPYVSHVLNNLSTNTPLYAATEQVLESVADTATTQGIIAAFPLPVPASFSVDPESALVLVLDRVRDPGNVGTLLRSAAAAGAHAVLLSRGCADIYNPKVVRSSAGGMFVVPHGTMSWNEISVLLRQLPHKYAARAQGPTPYYAAELKRGCAILIGNEADGLGPEALDLATEAISIPMASGFESLNAAVAGSLLLFEARRQREQSEDGANHVSG